VTGVCSGVATSWLCCEGVLSLYALHVSVLGDMAGRLDMECALDSFLPASVFLP